MISLIKNGIELLLVYKNSTMYTIHFIAIILLTIGLIWLCKIRHQIQKADEERPLGNFSTHKNYVDYKKEVSENTNREVRKLEESAEYKRYLKRKE